MKIRELLSDEYKWTKGQLARDKLGNPISTGDCSAVCWCVSGAAMVCYEQVKRWSILNDISRRVGRFVPAWNDDPKTTFTEVKAVLEELDV